MYLDEQQNADQPTGFLTAGRYIWRTAPMPMLGEVKCRGREAASQQSALVGL